MRARITVRICLRRAARRSFWHRNRSIDGALGLAAVERKRGNLDFEMFAASSHHAVGADHETRGRLQRNAAGIFEGFSCFKNWFLADNAGPADLLPPSMGIGDAPMTGFQLHWIAAFVGNGDRVGPEEIVVLRR